VALAVAMPDGGLITPVLKDADKVDIYQLSRCGADGRDAVAGYY
jgi:pyruvate dehydrogenase E2 component (dihydrolipoamide acetyltransferase)